MAVDVALILRKQIGDDRVQVSEHNPGSNVWIEPAPHGSPDLKRRDAGPESLSLLGTILGSGSTSPRRSRKRGYTGSGSLTEAVLGGGAAGLGGRIRLS